MLSEEDLPWRLRYQINLNFIINTYNNKNYIFYFLKLIIKIFYKIIKIRIFNNNNLYLNIYLI